MQKFIKIHVNILNIFNGKTTILLVKNIYMKNFYTF